MTIRITTWNINGYRAALNKGFKNWLENEKPEIVCLQEIKVQVHQLSEEQKTYTGYPAIFWNPAQKPGYSGVATFCREQPAQYQAGFGVEEFDSEGRVLLTKFPGISLFNVYFPNGQRGQERVDYKLIFYQHLLDLVQQLRANSEEIIITGDFNTAHREMDLARPRENAKTSGFLPEERAMVDRYLETGLVDIFRQLYPDKVQYTYWDMVSGARKRNVGWRIDYFLITPGLIPQVQDAVIHDEVLGSDHCPLSLILK